MGIDDATEVAPEAEIVEVSPAIDLEKPDVPPPLPRRRETVVLIASVVLADIAIYRSHGFAGPALWFAALPLLFFIGSQGGQRARAWWLLGGMLWLLAVRLVWCGSVLQVTCGVVLAIAFAAALAGMPPYPLLVMQMAAQIFHAGYLGFARHSRYLRQPDLHPRQHWLNLIMPVAALFLFCTLFVLANPDAVSYLRGQIEWVVREFGAWLRRLAVGPMEILFWLATAWLTAGLLRPLMKHVPTARRADKNTSHVPTEAPLYPACRNTLITVILVFGIYLAVEFQTLWFREFPEGFYYAGYAHEGAAWLTLALGLATILLSLVFSGNMPHDPP